MMFWIVPKMTATINGVVPSMLMKPVRLSLKMTNEKANAGNQEDDGSERASNTPAETADDIASYEEHHQNGHQACNRGEIPHVGAVVVWIWILDLQLAFPSDFNQVDRNAVTDDEDREAADVLGFCQIAKISL